MCYDGKNVEGICCLYDFQWIKLKFGEWDNLGLQISYTSSKSQDQQIIIRRMTVFFSSCFLFKRILINWLPCQQGMIYLQPFNFKDSLDICLKSDVSLVKVS